MPLYEYECEACGHRFEKIQKFSDLPETTCPKCGGPIHKMMSSPAFHLKGTGWYATDYPKKGEGAKTEGAKGEGETTKSETAKSETAKSEGPKDAAKTETAAADKPAATTPAKTSD